MYLNLEASNCSRIKLVFLKSRYVAMIKACCVTSEATVSIQLKFVICYLCIFSDVIHGQQNALSVGPSARSEVEPRNSLVD